MSNLFKNFSKHIWLSVLLVLIIFGCATETNDVRPTQGLLNSCVLYALADAIEIQTGRSISRDERLKAWNKTKHSDRGTTIYEAFSAAIKFGWLPKDSWLMAVTDLNNTKISSLICDIGGHMVVLLSIKDGNVIYLDPRYIDPQSMSIKQMDRATKGFYWRIMVNQVL